MEMHQLRYLEAVAKSGSMMAASASCHVTQPALSVQIKKLEEELGVRLLVRGARGVALTLAGERTLSAARRVLREVDALRSDIRKKSLRAQPVLRVSAQPFLATEVLPGPIAALFGSGGLGWKIEIRERTPAKLVESVSGGGSDLGILDLTATGLGALVHEELARVGYALFCPEEHSLARRSVVRLSQIAEHPVLIYQQASGLEARLSASAEKAGGELNVPFASDYASSIFEMAVARVGIAVLPASFARRAKRRHLVARPISDFSDPATIAAVWRPDGELPSLARVLLEGLREELRRQKEVPIPSKGS